MIFTRPEWKSVRHFVQETAELISQRCLPERALGLSLQDYEALRQDMAVEPPEGAEQLELALWCGEERFSVKPVLGQAPRTLSATK